MLRRISLSRGLGRKYATGPPEKKGPADPRLDNMKAALYPPSRTERSAYPTGLHRPDAPQAFERALPSAEAHETIERAWKLFQRQKREKHQAELARMQACMQRAMDDLENTDSRLYRIATSKPDPRKIDEATEAELKQYKGASRRALEARIEGLFPRDLRVPVDTPSRSGWNYDWKAQEKATEK